VRFLSMQEASAALGGVPSSETLRRLAAEGHLPVKRIGRRLVISENRLAEWADEVGDVRAKFYDGTSLGGAA
jgi:excisionase family DNA binding protein